jgi:tetratricopeptide (TPR) repeat protein
MNRLLCLLACFVLAYAAAYAQGPDEQYVRIYQSIQEADRLSDMGDQRSAAAKYVEAQQGLTRFRTIYPGWNERVINYRLNYVATKLAPITAALAGQGVPVPTSTNTNTVSAADVVSRPMTNTPTATLPITAPLTTALPMSAEFDRVRELQTEIERLKSDNKTLAAKLKEALSAQPAMVDPRDLAKAEERIRSLLKENELIKAQVAAQKNTPATPATPSPDLTAKLNEQNEAILALRTENDLLKKQTTEWRDKYAALSAAAEAARAQYATQAAESDAAMRKLAGESLGLQKQVELWKQVAQQNQQQNALAPIPAMPSDAQRELLNLRARVQTLEAKPVPYTSEELALFNRPPAALVANVATPSSAVPFNGVPPIEQARPKVSRGVPAGAQPLLRAAERAFATAQFADAERNYLEVLRQDENNVTTLGNLASAQVELGRYADAEKTVTKALSLDPEDFFSLYVLGRIRFRENKMDEALDALSRSAQSNPDYADAQNYLGIVLSEKGQRGPAEAALRRAIQLQPNNAVAHNNLAVVYATQTPPALALARWHYQKARDGGHPRNAQLEKMIDIKP